MLICTACRTAFCKTDPHNCEEALGVAETQLTDIRDCPPPAATFAAKSRGAAVEWDVDTELVLVEGAGCGRLEWYQGGWWMGFITRLELTPRGSRAYVMNDTIYRKGAWVRGVLPAGVSAHGGELGKQMREYVLLENIATLAEVAGVLHRIRRPDSLPPTPFEGDASSPPVQGGVAASRTRYASYFPTCPFGATFDANGVPLPADRPTPFGITAKDSLPHKLFKMSLDRPFDLTAAGARKAGDLVAFPSRVAVMLCRKSHRLERFQNAEWCGAFTGVTAEAGPNRYVLRPQRTGIYSEEFDHMRDSEAIRALYTWVLPAGRSDGVMSTLGDLRKLAARADIENDLYKFEKVQVSRMEMAIDIQPVATPDVGVLLQEEVFETSSKLWPLPTEGSRTSMADSMGVQDIMSDAHTHSDSEDVSAMASLPGTIDDSASSDTKVQNPCCVCLEAERNCVYFPCRHLVACIECSAKSAMAYCPVCRVRVMNRVEVWV